MQTKTHIYFLQRIWNQQIFRGENRDATPKRDAALAPWTIVNLSSYVLLRAIRTHFAFSLSIVQTKVCELTSCDLNIYHRRAHCCILSRTRISFIQLDKCVFNKSGNGTILPERRMIWLFKCLASEVNSTISRSKLHDFALCYYYYQFYMARLKYSVMLACSDENLFMAVGLYLIGVWA